MDETKELLRQKRNESGEYIIISEIKKNDKVYVDIRQYYTTEDNEVMPTKKGVRYNAEINADIVKALVMVMEEDEKEELIESMKQEEQEEQEE